MRVVKQFQTALLEQALLASPKFPRRLPQRRRQVAPGCVADAGRTVHGKGGCGT
jgi:hypothetical protein